MLSSSRSKANGFSLRCCGSDLCRRRLPGAAPASRSAKAGRNSESLSGAGDSSGAGCLPSAGGTGVQGCQEEVEGALQSARLSSPCLGWEGAAEPPGFTMEEDLMKEISCKDRRRVSAGWGRGLCVQLLGAICKALGTGSPLHTLQKGKKTPKESKSLD